MTASTLLVSGLGDDTGGGLFHIAQSRVECIDRLSSTGLCVTRDRLIRVLWSSSNEGWTSDLLTYDSRGLKEYHRLDSLAEPHDILWDGSNYVIVSTADNSIVWVSRSGEVVKRWRAPGAGDAWHLNCLHQVGDTLYVSAFGRFQQHRQWVGPGSVHAGILFNIETGEDAVRGLTTPHSPRFIDGSWVICNSAHHEIVEVNPSNSERISRRVRLSSWTRGLAYDDNFLFVGESAGRHDPDPAPGACLVVLDRQTWAIVDRINLPFREIYDIVLADSSLVAGARNGFRTNPLRVAEQDQHFLFGELGIQPTRVWATGEPLPAHACRVRIVANIPPRLPANAYVEISCQITNQGSALLVTAPPNAVYASYKWVDPATTNPIPNDEGLRTRLPRTVVPGHSVQLQLGVRTPATPGTLQLRITLVQELVAWFDDLNENNRISQNIEIYGGSIVRS